MKTSHVAVFDATDSAPKLLWTLDCRGAYSGFFPDTGVYDINRTGRLKIVVDCEGTTVCPNFFGIFEYKEGRVHPVPADFQPLKTCRIELKDLNHDGLPEVINYPREYKALPRIYRWNGRRYTEANGDFPKFWLDYGRRYFGAGNPLEPLPLYVVVDGCTLAARVFRLARRVDMARETCLRARERILAGHGIREVSSPEYPRLSKDALQEIDRTLIIELSGPKHPG